MKLTIKDKYFNHDKIARIMIDRLRASTTPTTTDDLWDYMFNQTDTYKVDGDSYGKYDLRYVDFENVLRRLRVHGHITGDPTDGFTAGYIHKDENDDYSITKYDEDIDYLGADVIFAEIAEITF